LLFAIIASRVLPVKSIGKVYSANCIDLFFIQCIPQVKLECMALVEDLAVAAEENPVAAADWVNENATLAAIGPDHIDLEQALLDRGV